MSTPTPERVTPDACTCSYVDPKYWTTHYGAVEPGSTQEWDPDCPEHRIDDDEHLAVPFGVTVPYAVQA